MLAFQKMTCSASTPLPTHGAFADDVAVVTDSSHVKQILQIFTNYCKDFGLLYHPAKTEIMSMTPPPTCASTHTAGTTVFTTPQIVPEPLPISWTVTTRDGTPHKFCCLPNTAPPLKYLGVYVHHSQRAIEAMIRRDLNSDLEHYRNFALTSTQRLCIINQILIPRLVYKLLPYPLLVDISYLEKQLLKFLQSGGPDDLNTLSENLAYLTTSQLGAHLICIHKITTGRFLPLIQGILRNDLHTPPDLYRAMFSRFNEYHVRTSHLPMLDPVVSASKLHHSLHITSAVNPQPTLQNFGFLQPLPDKILPCQLHPNVFTTPFQPISTLSEQCLQSLRNHNCSEALETAPDWLSTQMQCFVIASSYTPPSKPETRLYKRQRQSLPYHTEHAGWSSLDCKLGMAFLGRTTGHLSGGRGIWQAILFTISQAERTKPLLILTNSQHATCLYEYTTDRGRKRVTKCKHRDLIWKILNSLALRLATTHIVWVKSKARIIPHVLAEEHSRTAMSLPLIPPRPSKHSPEVWIRNGLPIELPAASPLLDITELHHPPDLSVLNLKHVNLYLSSLNLLSNPSPKLVTYMHGRVNWTNFAWWFDYKTPRLCLLCGESTHATDVMTSLSQCRRLKEISASALCDGYKTLGPSILQWVLSSSQEDRRMFTRDLVPDSLADHLRKHKQMSDFKKARQPRAYTYLNIMNKLYCVAQDMFNQLSIPPDTS